MTLLAESEVRGKSAALAVTARSLDHFVIFGHDLETSAQLYGRLGFNVMPIMEHVEIGTSNFCVQFQDTYLEVISDFDHCRMDAVRRHCRPWEGLGDIYWQTSLTSAKLEADQAALQASGMNPESIVSARRRVRLPKGGWIDTNSRSMYVPNPARPHMSLFVSDHRRPEAIWIPDYQIHPNTVQRVATVRYLAKDPLEDLAYFTSMAGGAPALQSPDRITFRTPRGETLEILTPAEMAKVLPEASVLQPSLQGRGAAFTYTVESLTQCRLALRTGGVPHVARGDALVVRPEHACGMALEFVEAGDRS